MLYDNRKYTDREETIRRLGYKDKTPDGEIMKIIENAENELIKAAAPRYIHAEYDRDNLPFQLVGEDIKFHLDGCDKVILFAATLGSGVDRLIRSASVEDMTGAYVTDCIAGIFIEKFCDDEADTAMSQKYSGKFLTWRYGAGYGDFPIEAQKDIIRTLDATKKIGLSVTDSMMLTPLKSVTAVIGISDNELPVKRRGCAVCNMNKSCIYRKDGKRCGY